MLRLRITGTLKMRRLNQAGCVSMWITYTEVRSKVDRRGSRAAGAGENGGGMGCLEGFEDAFVARCLAFGGIFFSFASGGENYGVSIWEFFSRNIDDGGEGEVVFFLCLVLDLWN
jgi:hypothetical protein